jgi:Periplasmic binding protein
MGTPQTPRKRRSPMARYAPFIAVVAIVAIVAIVLSTRDNGKKKGVAVSGASSASNVPIFYSEAKADGTLDKYTWQDHCDKDTGNLAIPIVGPPPCVPKFSGDNGGATSVGVTADTIRIGYYMAKPDPAFDALTKAAGAYDTPASIEQTVKNYVQIFANMYELYGRKIQLVRIDGTGALNDEVAARADAKKAAADHVFAVIGGPAQAKSFSEELAANKILCVGTCIIAQPERYIRDNSPYLWTTNPSPEQTTTMTVEFIKKQLAGKNAEFAGSPALQQQKRKFALLTYDTPDGQFTSSQQFFEKKMRDAGLDVVGHVYYYLDLAKMQSDARTIATKLKSTGATSVVFTGDPLLPQFFTKEATKQGYFPEWIMSGTVLADTNVFARTFDQQQWKHAFGLQVIPARLPKDKTYYYTVHQWWFGTPPPAENAFGIVYGNVATLFTGLELAGPKLTPESFRDGMYHAPGEVQTTKPTLSNIDTWGRHGYWPGEDVNGLDNMGLMYWDPNARGPDETGTVANGMYRLVDGGLRYLPGKWPTKPIKLFDPTNTVTIYGENDIPAELLPKSEPVPPNAPTAKG